MSIEAMKQAYEVPLVEQLESVPNNARLVIDDADGMGTRYIPVGRMCHDASKALRQAIAEAEKQEPDKYAMDIECTKCGAQQSGILTVQTTPQPKHEQGYKDGYEAGWTKALNEAYSNREQEPVGWIDSKGNMICTKINESCKPLYTTPQQRKPLTDEQARAMWPAVTLVATQDIMKFVRAIEAAHGIKE